MFLRLPALRDLDVEERTILVTSICGHFPPELGRHERALAMRWQRARDRVLTYDDLLDMPRHMSALGRYDQGDLARAAGT
jgi:hypothetical protein